MAAIDISDVLMKVFGIFIRVLGVYLAYRIGLELSTFSPIAWKNYAAVLTGAAILSLVSWANLGTHWEDQDPIFGGGEEVIDFSPTTKQRNEHATVIFLVASISACSGVKVGQAKKKKNSDA